MDYKAKLLNEMDEMIARLKAMEEENQINIARSKRFTTIKERSVRADNGALNRKETK